MTNKEKAVQITLRVYYDSANSSPGGIPLSLENTVEGSVRLCIGSPEVEYTLDLAALSTAAETLKTICTTTSTCRFFCGDGVSIYADASPMTGGDSVLFMVAEDGREIGVHAPTFYAVVAALVKMDGRRNG